MIDFLARNIIEQTGLNIATLVRKIHTVEELINPNNVKVVLNRAGEAMYFSRQPIPFVRDAEIGHWLEHGTYYHHVGMYAYTSQALLAIEKMNMHPYESMEKLEQLTWLANGLSIQCYETEMESKGIDTEEDLRTVSSMIAELEV
jgi:3-deoxy-manno-octulosonate cytidylyltransferase (CMP-KDO synthetase)